MKYQRADWRNRKQPGWNLQLWQLARRIGNIRIHPVGRISRPTKYQIRKGSQRTHPRRKRNFKSSFIQRLGKRSPRERIQCDVGRPRWKQPNSNYMREDSTSHTKRPNTTKDSTTNQRWKLHRDHPNTERNEQPQNRQRNNNQLPWPVHIPRMRYGTEQILDTKWAWTRRGSHTTSRTQRSKQHDAYRKHTLLLERHYKWHVCNICRMSILPHAGPTAPQQGSPPLPGTIIPW